MNNARIAQNRHIQMIGIGGNTGSFFICISRTLRVGLGTIGTALFVQIGSALVKGGPGNHSSLLNRF